MDDVYKTLGYKFELKICDPDDALIDSLDKTFDFLGISIEHFENASYIYAKYPIHVANTSDDRMLIGIGPHDVVLFERNQYTCIAFMR